jgi:hypothetical protein
VVRIRVRPARYRYDIGRPFRWAQGIQNTFQPPTYVVLKSAFLFLVGKVINNPLTFFRDTHLDLSLVP